MRSGGRSVGWWTLWGVLVVLVEGGFGWVQFTTVSYLPVTWYVLRVRRLTGTERAGGPSRKPAYERAWLTRAHRYCPPVYPYADFGCLLQD